MTLDVKTQQVVDDYLKLSPEQQAVVLIAFIKVMNALKERGVDVKWE